MGAVYLKCKHGKLLKGICLECVSENDEMKALIYDNSHKQEKDKRTPILRGCDNQVCNCTGRCKDIIGYYE